MTGSTSMTLRQAKKKIIEVEEENLQLQAEVSKLEQLLKRQEETLLYQFPFSGYPLAKTDPRWQHFHDKVSQPRAKLCHSGLLKRFRLVFNQKKVAHDACYQDAETNLVYWINKRQKKKFGSLNEAFEGLSPNTRVWNNI